MKNRETKKNNTSFILYLISDPSGCVYNFIDFSWIWLRWRELLLMASSLLFAILANLIFFTAGEAISSSSELLAAFAEGPRERLRLIDSSWGFFTSRLSLLTGSSLWSSRLVFRTGAEIGSTLLPLFDELNNTLCTFRRCHRPYAFWQAAWRFHPSYPRIYG